MADDTEQKAWGFKWYDILGMAVVAAAVSGFIAGATCYREGRNKGYNVGISEGYNAGVVEGRDAGYGEGKMQGFAEGLAAGTVVEANKPKPWAYGWNENGSIFASFQRNVEGTGLVTYSIALNAAMIGTGEAAKIDYADGTAVSLADNLPHDGLVDLITHIGTNGEPTSYLFRSMNYTEYPQIFQNADETMKKIKAIFAENQ